MRGERADGDGKPGVARAHLASDGNEGVPDVVQRAWIGNVEQTGFSTKFFIVLGSPSSATTANTDSHAMVTVIASAWKIIGLWWQNVIL